MKFEIGGKYSIRFHDHCVGEFDVLCEVTIWVTKETKTHVYGTWWKVISDDPEVEEFNREMVSIIKSAIVKRKKWKDTF